jgi:hypothetical protein
MKLVIASPSKQEWFLQRMQCTLLSQILIVAVKSQTKMCLNYAYLMKECMPILVASLHPNLTMFPHQRAKKILIYWRALWVHPMPFS